MTQELVNSIFSLQTSFLLAPKQAMKADNRPSSEGMISDIFTLLVVEVVLATKKCKKCFSNWTENYLSGSL